MRERSGSKSACSSSRTRSSNRSLASTKSMMGSGPSISATSFSPASMNATTSSAREDAGPISGGTYGMATLRVVALRAGARCVITPTPPRAGSTALSGHHQLQFQQVSPMLPVYSVTDLPGCSVLPDGVVLEGAVPDLVVLDHERGASAKHGVADDVRRTGDPQ